MKLFSNLFDSFAPADGPPPKTLYAFMRWALKGALPFILLMFFVGAAVGGTEVLAAYLVGWLIDTATARGPEDLFPAFWLTLAGVAVFFLVFRPLMMGLGAALTSISMQPNLFPLVMQRLNRHVLGQSLSYFDDDFAGRIAQKAQQTSRAVSEVMVESANTFGLALASIIGAALLMASVDVWLAVIVFAWLIAYFFLIRFFMPRIRARSKARAAARAVVTGQVVDTVSNIATVKLFAHGDFEDQATLDALAGFRECGIRFGRVSASFRLILMAFAGILPVTLIGGSIFLWSRGIATPGDIAASGLVSTRLAQMSGWVSMTAMGIFANVGEIEDGIRTLSPSHSVVDRENAVEPRKTTGGGEVVFDNVVFGYGRPDAALDGLNLRVAPGEKVALVGRSGAGKTTAVSLLLRLYDVEGGRVMLDGVDIRDLTQDGLRSKIGMVRQETAMFNRPAIENIRYGNPDATDEQVIQAAKRAHAHDFIQDLSDFRGRKGYAAHLGERGVKLSGGQRQRIALARVILKDAPVLVLDEATSALDSEVEAAIQDTLETVMEGKTVIAIAHRLSTIARMDRIVVLDQGRIVEEGSHNDLLNSGGLYAGLWDHQSGGFLGLEAAE